MSIFLAANSNPKVWPSEMAHDPGSIWSPSQGLWLRAAYLLEALAAGVHVNLCMSTCGAWSNMMFEHDGHMGGEERKVIKRNCDLSGTTTPERSLHL